MKEMEYSEAATQVLDILNYTRQEDVNKIPQSFINFLNNISNKKYAPKFNHEYPISALNLTKKTKELLGFIYITWWANSEEREKYKKLIHNKNSIKEEIKERYNINDIFENKKEEKEKQIIKNESIMETRIVEYKKENLIKKFFNKILNFFGSKKERK